jgi:hypothetical protein
VDDLTRTKQRIQKFLLRHGFRYESERYWTGLHIKWMRGLEFGQTLEKETFEQYLSHLEELTERIERMYRHYSGIPAVSRLYLGGDDYGGGVLAGKSGRGSKR